MIIDNDKQRTQFSSKYYIEINISDEWDCCVPTNFHFIIIGRIAAVTKAVFQFTVDYLVHGSKSSNIKFLGRGLVYYRFN